ncbi:MAG TPA: hypothetical protein VGD45_17840 [Steroidobacter sp.]|uniref:hypothetical protein n=1 Tax=Steroidobacter sp. TaxID=1978227 RepID=UPI002EDA0A55
MERTTVLAAWDASVAALAPIVDSLLPSALDLVHRMIELRDGAASDETFRRCDE